MRSRRRRRTFPLKYQRRVSALLFLSCCFLLGGLSGCFWANSLSDNGSIALWEYVNSYLTVLREGTVETGDLLKTSWELFRWPVLTILFAFTAPGLVVIPILFLLRGFLLSFSIACFVRVLGSSGAILAFFLFGISGSLSLPVLFVLGNQGMEACRKLCLRLLGSKPPKSIYGNEYFIRCGLCAAVLCICVCLEQSVVPRLLAMLAGTF